ncbi:MAG TPA: 4-hydroxythreonine-4-phosphate dehydrogenase PdxA [Casimicrobiaceae bacterium]|nr:4-hydroxythreonine-4-phosphate dehydrogenase PdxA [Casimicrobiaceae bacterium]
MSRPRIAFVAGDPNGIGPELTAKLLSRETTIEAADVIVYADPAMIVAGERIAKVHARLGRPNGGRRATLKVLDLGGERAITPGVATEAGGRAALVALEAAARDASRGDVAGIVFAPLNKHALRLAGMTHEDELRLLQERFGVDGFVSEFNITGSLWTSRVTSHVPLRDVADALTVDGVVQAVELVHRYLVASGRSAPRIAVTGLNPHAGDGGSIGREEIEVIAPAIDKARALGMTVAGPMPSDTVFLAAKRGDYDAVVTMYHDQGQIAMKLMGFDNGVTLHGGLPVPVATCASGTAFDIVGRNVANVEGLQQAFDLAVAIASRSGT